MSVLKQARHFEIDDNEYVFPGDRRAALSNMSLLTLLRRMGRFDLTTNGFRSTFRDWAAERTNFPREVAEMALAHTVGDKVEAAYRADAENIFDDL
jgi:integrase